jgi:hypothetical protein
MVLHIEINLAGHAFADPQGGEELGRILREFGALCKGGTIPVDSYLRDTQENVVGRTWLSNSEGKGGQLCYEQGRVT